MMKRTVLCFTVLIIVTAQTALTPAASGVDNEERAHISLVLMGDVVIDGRIENLIHEKGSEYPFEELMPMISDADITLANLETPISERGQEEVDKYCTFRSEPETIECLEYAGIDGVSLANNHCLDYGEVALNDTMLYLDQAGIGYTGIWYSDNIGEAKLERPLVMESNGLSIGFLAYTEDVRGHWSASPDRGGPMPLERKLMEDDIRVSGEMVDILIVSIHWRKWPQYTKGPEGPDIDLCHDLVDLGADVIMGHGPHTVHEVEEYNGSVIFYSLGNALMDCGNESSFDSYVVKALMGPEGIRSFTLIPTHKDNYRYVPSGTPVERDREVGFNVSYDQVQNMYIEDIYHLISEDDGNGGDMIGSFRENPWSHILIIASVVCIIASVAYLTLLVRRRKKNSYLPCCSI